MYKRQANEVANALAEHCSGSIDAFAELMNEKARSLGCTSSNFANPSGLNDENHYTSAYDMALISDVYKRQALPFVGRLNTVFVTAIALGMGMILLTMIVNMAVSFKCRDTEKTWFDTNGLAGFVFYLSLAAVIILYMTGRPLPATAVLAVMFVVPLLLIFLKEPLAALVERRGPELSGGAMFFVAVSYTHLDVYKRQDPEPASLGNRLKENLLARDTGLFSFYPCENEQQVRDHVAARKAECGYLIPENLEQKINSGRFKRSITVFSAPSTMTASLSTEVVFSELAAIRNKDILEDYVEPVSYTHLDVYKRQALSWGSAPC